MKAIPARLLRTITLCCFAKPINKYLTVKGAVPKLKKHSIFKKSAGRSGLKSLDRLFVFCEWDQEMRIPSLVLR